VTVYVKFSIACQESRFVRDTQAPRGKLLQSMPTSSAFGCGQIVDMTR